MTLLKKFSTTAIIELLIIFIFMPLAFYAYGNRWNIPLVLWVVFIYAALRLHFIEHVNWRGLWHGIGWGAAQKKAAFLRFCIAAPLIIFLTYYLAPNRMFSFPLQRPLFWLMVMLLYPWLSVLPQELIFRSYFFRRYESLFTDPWLMIIASGLSFGFMHIVFHNLISPVLCIIGGTIFAYSYGQHRSVKWSVIEHAAYGCFVFTAGIGYYFVVGLTSRL